MVRSVPGQLPGLFFCPPQGRHSPFLKEKEIDGIFASSDVIAAQVIQICRKKGINIPDQIKLVGFDDSLISMLTSPAITTIRQPIPEMASLAVQTILRASNKEMVPSRTILPVSLVERETT